MNAYVHESKIEMEMIKEKIKKIVQKQITKKSTLQLEAPKEKNKRNEFLEEVKVDLEDRESRKLNKIEHEDKKMIKTKDQER